MAELESSRIALDRVADFLLAISTAENFSQETIGQEAASSHERRSPLRAKRIAVPQIAGHGLVTANRRGRKENSFSRAGAGLQHVNRTVAPHRLRDVGACGVSRGRVEVILGGRFPGGGERREDACRSPAGRQASAGLGRTVGLKLVDHISLQEVFHASTGH